MKFLMVNGEFYRDSNGKLITVPDNYNNELLTIGGKVLNIGGKLVGDKYSRGIFLTQLSTPANVSANGTTVSWDEVENATSYEVRADGVSIGTVEKKTGYNVTVVCPGYPYTLINVYDKKGGNILGTFNGNESILFTNVTSLYVDAGSAAYLITNVAATDGITTDYTSGNVYNVTIMPLSNGTVTLTLMSD